MKYDWKRIGAGVGRMVGAAVLLGPVLTIGLISLSLRGWAPYIQRALMVGGVVALIAAMLLFSGLLGRRGLRWLGGGILVTALACLGYCAWGAQQAQIPTLDDRMLMLEEYQPFSMDTKAVYLGEASTLQLAKGDLPRLDGATALYPVYAAFVQAAYPQDVYPLYGRSGGDETVMCSNTVYAYDRLLRGETDLIFTAGPSKDQRAAAEAAGMQLHLTPIGREAFVFFVNSQNPVTGLTVDQVRGIYSGQITRWSQVGGEERSIRPFQRAENSGSQTALQRLMGDLPLIRPEREDRVGDMGGIIRQVAEYRNHANAIGFTFRFYATEMVGSGDIHLLALDGVAPTRESIRDGSYPISSEFYAVTASAVGQPAPQETDAQLAALLDWILGPQGQALVEATGYVGLF